MRLPRFRVRTQMVIVGVVALFIWGAIMGSRSYEYYRRAREFGANERGWRETAARHREWATFGAQCAEYYAQLAEKYRRAMWRPWTPLAQDPHAPGWDAYQEQEQRRRSALEPVPTGGGNLPE
jgi:hypothetical protein